MQLISAEDIAKRLRVPKITVYAWARRGELPHYRFGRSVRFSEAEVEAYLRDRYVPAKMKTGGTADEN